MQSKLEKKAEKCELASQLWLLEGCWFKSLDCGGKHSRKCINRKWKLCGLRGSKLLTFGNTDSASLLLHLKCPLVL